ncbi:hypothetical protein V6Z12_D11G224700 [Gossypium hirsutum]
MATMLIERKQVASVGKTCTAKSSPFLNVQRYSKHRGEIESILRKLFIQSSTKFFF